MAKKSKSYNKIIILSIAALALMTPFFVNFITNNQQTIENYAAPPKNTVFTIILNPTEKPPALGDYISFTTTYPKTLKNPRIQVICYQNNELVYGEAGSANDQFLLGGGWSKWKEIGGPAECFVDLYYFDWQKGTQTFNKLASTNFPSLDR
jgi:hypothetical protein